MNEERTDVAIDADAGTKRRLGSLPACLALDCADIGEATVNGERVIITWGRNLTAKQQRWFARNTDFKPIRVGADDGSTELVIPHNLADQLLDIIGRNPGGMPAIDQANAESE